MLHALSRLLALLPDRDPPGPLLPHILLGLTFFLHHSRLRLSLRYGEIESEPGTPPAAVLRLRRDLGLTLTGFTPASP